MGVEDDGCSALCLPCNDPEPLSRCDSLNHYGVCGDWGPSSFLLRLPELLTGNGEILERVSQLTPPLPRAHTEPCCGGGETPRGLCALSHSPTLHEHKLHLEEDT